LRCGRSADGFSAQKRVDDGLKHVLVHSIAADGFTSALTSTQHNARCREFLVFLRDQGRDAGSGWRRISRQRESSVDVEKMYL
jgi:hypothetical protein